ncbi:hypothetical protein GCM10029978_102600 [Actinoallomurus acanthiterrae]
MDLRLTGLSRSGVAALGSAAALITGLAGEPPARGAVTAHAWPAMVQPRLPGLTITERNRMLALPFLVEHGWSYRQYQCLDRLWMRESSWNQRARNPWSGAYGIPQALPAAKMRTAGPDWKTSPATQIKWGLGYIQSRYGNPCAALGHSGSAGWY